MTVVDWPVGGAAAARDWVVWASIIIGGLATIWAALWSRRSPFRRTITWLFNRNVGQPVGNFVRGVILEVVKPDLESISDKVDELAVRNDRQHADNAALIAELRTNFAAHMDEARHDREQLQAIALATDMHVAALRHDLANPGLPSAKG